MAKGHGEPVMTRRPSTSPFRRFLPGMVILLLSLMLAGCESATPAAPNPAASVTPAAPAAAPTQPEFYRTSGPIVVENQVDVSAQREGMVTEILADVGELVHRGQLLAR